jgi:ABC-type lipoprotein export system ATPase subunit
MFYTGILKHFGDNVTSWIFHGYCWLLNLYKANRQSMRNPVIQFVIQRSNLLPKMNSEINSRITFDIGVTYRLCAYDQSQKIEASLSKRHWEQDNQPV